MASVENDIQLTPDEYKSVEEALKKSEFRKMLADYMQELEDPKNREEYNLYIKQLEAEAAINTKDSSAMIVIPNAAFVVKTKSTLDNKKFFINICTSDKVGKASQVKVKGPEGKVGSNWSIPLSLGPPRKDIDNAGAECTIYDIIYHPETVDRATKDPRFHQFICRLAVEYTEKKANVKLAHDYSLPKMKYKNLPVVAQTIRNTPNASSSGPSSTPSSAPSSSKSEPPKSSLPNIKDPIIESAKLASAATQRTAAQSAAAAAPSSASISSNSAQPPKKLIEEIVRPSAPTPTPASAPQPAAAAAPKSQQTPTYTMVHRGSFDLANHFGPGGEPSTSEAAALSVSSNMLPQELVFRIELPQLDSISSVNLDISQRHLSLDDAAKLYKLQLDLPFMALEDDCQAKFDKKSRILTVTVPVDTAAETKVRREQLQALRDQRKQQGYKEPDSVGITVVNSDESGPELISADQQQREADAEKKKRREEREEKEKERLEEERRQWLSAQGAEDEYEEGQEDDNGQRKPLIEELGPKEFTLSAASSLGLEGEEKKSVRFAAEPQSSSGTSKEFAARLASSLAKQATISSAPQVQLRSAAQASMMESSAPSSSAASASASAPSAPIKAGGVELKNKLLFELDL